MKGNARSNSNHQRTSSRNAQASDKVLIIGAGAAGLSASSALAERGVASVLVDCEDSIGGRARQLGCKGINECVQCDVCLVADKANYARGSDLVEITTSTEIVKVDHQADSIDVQIRKKNGKKRTIRFKTLIVCTGADAFVPPLGSRYGYGEIPGVLTSQEVESSIEKNGRIISDQRELKKIAIIQCVGSRGDKGGVEYCSSVCCKYALKIGKLASKQFPDAQISFFFMDWRACDGRQNDLESWARSSENVQIIRSRPAEILLSENGKPLIRYASSSDEVIEDDQDLVILSVGLVPSSSTMKMARMLGLELDEFGFIKTRSGTTRTSIDRIFAAGCATGPCDIEAAVSSGQAAAYEACPDPSAKERVVIVGAPSEKISLEAEKIGPNVLTVPKAMAISGVPGNFSVWIDGESLSRSIDCSAVILSDSSILCDIDSRFITLDELRRIVEDSSVLSTAIFLPERGDCISRESEHRKALELAIEIRRRSPSASVTIISPEVLAIGKDELLYKRAQANGVLFVRSSDLVLRSPSGLEAIDAITQSKIFIPAEVIAVSGWHSSLAMDGKNFGISFEFDGHPASSPVKWKPSSTLRKGIFLCGAQWQTEEEKNASLLAAVNQAAAFIKERNKEGARASVDEEKCSSCLTCVRSCPFEASFINGDGFAEIDNRLCRGCGICVGICPSRAISLDPCTDETILSQIGGGH